MTMKNREIKFRAWDGDEMFNDIYFTKANNRLIDLYQYNHNTLLKHITLIDKDHLSFMQYTGIKDKEGKEVYEGDIINIDNSEPEENGEYDAIVIVENKDGWIFELCNANGDGGTWTRQFHTTTAKDRENRLTVIGNLYENPNLIKDIFENK